MALLIHKDARARERLTRRTNVKASFESCVTRNLGNVDEAKALNDKTCL